MKNAMISKILVATSGIMSLTLTVSTAFANPCEGEEARCGTVGVSAAGAVGSGAYSMVKYTQAQKFEEASTKVVVDLGNGSAALNEGSIMSYNYNNGIQEGDKVTITYNLSEAANRKYHIELMESRASSAESSASYHRSQAASALVPRTVTETVTKSNGETETVTRIEGPDWSEHARQMSLAEDEDRKAARYWAEAKAARNGGKVPIYDFDHVIDSPSGTASESTQYMRKMMKEGSTLKKLARLPAAQFAQLKKLINKGRAGLVGVVAGTALIVEEATAGVIADQVDKTFQTNSVPAYRGYRSGGGMR